MNKDTKIPIPEIPGEWTQRSRSGHTNTWNCREHHRFHRTSTDLPEVVLQPPEKGLYAERIDGAWYWVSGCAKCTGSGEHYSYVVCDKHNICEGCGAPRHTLTETPWGTRTGFICKPCGDARDKVRRDEALAKAKVDGHSEDDCRYTDDILCPYCASKQSTDDRHESAKGLECDTCQGVFDLEVEYSPSYTTTKAE
jgi:hypothetical protein